MQLASIILQEIETGFWIRFKNGHNSNDHLFRTKANFSEKVLFLTP